MVMGYFVKVWLDEVVALLVQQVVHSPGQAGPDGSGPPDRQLEPPGRVKYVLYKLHVPEFVHDQPLQSPTHLLWHSQAVVAVVGTPDSSPNAARLAVPQEGSPVWRAAARADMAIFGLAVNENAPIPPWELRRMGAALNLAALSIH
jgi:hypothetical protein